MKIAALMISVLMMAIGGTLIANVASSASGPLLNGDNNCDGSVTVADGCCVPSTRCIHTCNRDAPPSHFSIVRVKVTNVSADDPANPDPSFALRMVGSENVGYTTFGNSCGVIPDPFRRIACSVVAALKETSAMRSWTPRARLDLH
jgi:hypothetical protein